MGVDRNRPLHKGHKRCTWKNQSPGGTDGTVFQGNQEGGLAENWGRDVPLPHMQKEEREI